MARVILGLIGLGLFGCLPEKLNTTSSESSFSIKGWSVVAPAALPPDSTYVSLGRSNANWVAYSPYAFCKKGDSRVYYNQQHWEGESLEGATKVLLKLKQQGFKVLLKPHLWLSGGGFTGDYLPNNSDLWFSSYTDYILDFAKVAESLDLEMFCIGTEKGMLVTNYPKRWEQLIQKVRGVYSGKLTYAANWDAYTRVPFWNKLDYIGVDAYFPLSHEEKPTKEQLLNGWKPILQSLEGFSLKAQKKIIFTEIGFRNTTYTTKRPWAEPKLPRCDECQSIAYDAMFTALQSQGDWFSGLFVWKYFLNNPRQNPRFSPQNLQGNTVIENNFKKG